MSRSVFGSLERLTPRRLSKSLRLALLIIGLYFGSLSFLGGMLSGITNGEDSAPQEARVAEAQAVIAAERIQKGETIRADILLIVPYPNDWILESMLRTPEQAAGRTAAVDIERGMVLTSAYLQEQDG